MLFARRERAIRRLIIVEDEPLVAFDNEHLLSEAGYEVVATVDSLAEAKAVIEMEPLDLVLSDIRLNGEGDGLDVARAAAERWCGPIRSAAVTPSAKNLPMLELCSRWT